MQTYSVALSYASEQHDYVSQVSKALAKMGINHFFDKNEEVVLWSTDAAIEFTSVFSERSVFVIVFASQDYARKLWTNFELRAALTSPNIEKSILYVSFDGTRLDEVKPTMLYKDADALNPVDLACSILKKMDQVLNSNWHNLERRFERYVLLHLQMQVRDILAKGGYETLNEATKGKTNVSSLKQRALGVDVGTTKIAAGVIELCDRKHRFLKPPITLLHEESANPQVPDTFVKRKQLIEKIFEIIDIVLSDTNMKAGDLDSIGLGVPGQVDPEDGQLTLAPGLNVRDLDILGALRPRYQIPIYIDNDVNCATVTELLYGRGLLYPTFMCVFIGTGIGAGIMVNRKLLRGKNSAAGEIGHMKVDFSDSALRCTCNAKGCLEVYASARAIIRSAKDVIDDYRADRNKSSLARLDKETLCCEDIAEVCAEGDPWAQDIAKKAAYYLGLGLSNATKLVDPHAIFIGGGIIEGFGKFDWFISERVKTMEGALLNPHCSLVKVHDVTHKDSPVVGAASLMYYEKEVLVV